MKNNKTLDLAVKESKSLMIKAERIKIYQELLDKMSTFIYYDRESRREEEELRELKRATMILRGHLSTRLAEVYQKIFGWGCILSDEDSKLKLELQKFALEAIVVEDEVPWRLLNDHTTFYNKDDREFKKFIKQIEKKRTQKIIAKQSSFSIINGEDERVEKIKKLEKQIKNLHSQIVADYITSPDEEIRSTGAKYIKENNLKEEED